MEQKNTTSTGKKRGCYVDEAIHYVNERGGEYKCSGRKRKWCLCCKHAGQNKQHHNYNVIVAENINFGILNNVEHGIHHLAVKVRRGMKIRLNHKSYNSNCPLVKTVFPLHHLRILSHSYPAKCHLFWHSQCTILLHTFDGHCDVYHCRLNCPV